jgi:hypothetical protein
MPVRVKPPPADTGKMISPAWAARTVTTPEYGANFAVGETLLCVRESGACDFLRAFRDSWCCFQGIVDRFGAVVCLRANHALSDLFFVAFEGRSAVIENNLRRMHICSCLRDSRFDLLVRSSIVGFVQAGDHLILIHALTSFDQHFHYLAGDFRRYRGLTTCNDIAGRIKRRCATRCNGASNFARRSNPNCYATVSRKSMTTNTK